MTPEEMDDLLEDYSEAELGVALFVGKLRQLTKAGVKFGISPDHLNQLLVAINVAFEDLTTPGEGRPN